MMMLAAMAIPVDDIESSEFADFDGLGTLFGVNGLILFKFAWNKAAVVGWQTVYTYIQIIVSAIFLAAFVWVEPYVTRHPIMPLKAMTSQAAFALSVISAGWGSFGIWVYYPWRFIEHVRGHSALSACALNVPIALTGLAATLTTGFLLSHIKSSPVLLITTLCLLFGQILIATSPVGQTYWAQTFVSILFMPEGMKKSFPFGIVLLSSATAKEHQGIAASLVSTAVNYSISLALGLAGTMMRSVDPTGKMTLHGYRAAWYFGKGLDGLSVAIALYFVLRHG